MRFARLGHAHAEGVEEPIDGPSADVGQVGHFRRFQIEGEEPHDLPKFGLRNM
jgi:hypothetical protein